MKELSEQEFKAKVSEYVGGFEKWQFKGERPAVIDFYATWCGPCRMIAPSLENLAKKYEGKVDFYKVNVDNCRNLAIAYSVESIPMVIFAPKDASPQYILGAYSEEEYDKVIQYLFKGL